jgi:hypothetical protein
VPLHWALDPKGPNSMREKGSLKLSATSSVREAVLLCPRSSIAASSRLATSLTAGRSHVIMDDASDESIREVFQTSHSSTYVCPIAPNPFVDPNFIYLSMSNLLFPSISIL